MGIKELFVEFGTGKNKKYIKIEIAQFLGKDRCNALPFFHAFTGCDQVSFFASCKKTKAWNTWSSLPDMTEVFLALSNCPSPSQVAAAMPLIERFTYVMYKRTTNCLTVDETRREMFVEDGNDLSSIPPTSSALREHTKRVAYVAGRVWGNR